MDLLLYCSCGRYYFRKAHAGVARKILCPHCYEGPYSVTAVTEDMTLMSAITRAKKLDEAARQLLLFLARREGILRSRRGKLLYNSIRDRATGPKNPAWEREAKKLL